ncbi:MAG TPA: hypothetical protein VGN27_10830 [Gaiellaceae bacterium]|jgi:hypothetical protein|nr:hypothetical protein [Gaiellaceae bacterium]
MSRKIIPRLLAAAATLAVLVAALTVIGGTSLAAGSAAEANYAPQNTAAPSISGNAQIGQTLTANTGTWNSQTTPTYSYAWQQCDAQGNACTAIKGATGTTYAVQTADAGKTIRVVVTATSSSGSTSATSAQTAVVGQPGPEGAIKLSNGATSIPASSVTGGERLVIDSLQFSPGRLMTRAPFTGRFHVSDTRGYVVRDALVLVTGLPYAWAQTSGEVRTDQTGWATMTINPTVNMPLGRHDALVMFVRARVEGQPVLAGSSSRRLVQVSIR